MMSEQEIMGELERVGFKNAEIRKVMKDVGQVIGLKVVAAYLQTLPEDERMKIESMNENDAQSYFAERAESLPVFPQEQFDAIHDDTWREYLRDIAEM